jgi:hypothetical protein
MGKTSLVFAKIDLDDKMVEFAVCEDASTNDIYIYNKIAIASQEHLILIDSTRWDSLEENGVYQLIPIQKYFGPEEGALFLKDGHLKFQRNEEEYYELNDFEQRIFEYSRQKAFKILKES